MVKVKKYRVKRIRPRLEIGEVFCDHCDGSGLVKEKQFRSPLTDGLCKFIEEDCYIVDKQCPTCKGEGKLDWVENVVGKHDSDKPRRVKKRFKIISES